MRHLPRSATLTTSQQTCENSGGNKRGKQRRTREARKSREARITTARLKRNFQTQCICSEIPLDAVLRIFTVVVIVSKCLVSSGESRKSTKLEASITWVASLALFSIILSADIWSEVPRRTLLRKTSELSRSQSDWKLVYRTIERQWGWRLFGKEFNAASTLTSFQFRGMPSSPLSSWSTLKPETFP